jgi:diguanylate cyclase (GGDEF)-like protein
MDTSTPERWERVSSTVAQTLDGPASLEARVAGACSVGELADVVVAWVQEQGLPLPSIFFEVAGRLRRVALRGYWQILEGFSIDHGIIAETFRSGQAQFVPDVSADPRYIAAVPDVVSELSLPLHHQGRVVGIMNVESPEPLPDAQSATATAAAACFERRLEQLDGPDPESPWQRLARRSGELAELEDPDDIGAFTVTAACETVGFESAVLVIERRGERYIHAACGPLEDQLRALPPASLEALASWTVSATSVYTLGDISGKGFAGHEALQRIGIRSMASASLQSHGGRHGFLLTASCRNVETEVSRVQHLEVLATHTASALYTAFALETLRERASQDPLTRLGHGGAFHERLSLHLEEAMGPTAVLLMDLDNFRAINDLLGHLVGDRVLVETADLLRSTLRRGDELFRIGGDEFAAILDVRDHAEAMEVAERLNRASRDRGRTAVSIGVVVVAPGEDVDSDTIFGCADLALNDAKRGGRDRAALFHPELQEAAREESRLLAELPAAIEEGQLVLQFQPVVSLGRRRMLGVETLVRWRHPQHGMIPPFRFIPLAERGDHIAAIGRWVLTEACRAYARWRDDGWMPEELWVGINVSAAELGPGFVDNVLDTLVRFDVPADHFIVEVTENTFIDEHHAVPPLRALRDVGVNVAVDDFGTGYSSLSYLHRLPVNILKIDRSFVAGLTDPKTAAVTRSIVELAHTLGLDVVAEGVEQAEQLDLLRDLGCRTAQGFYWSRPVDESELPRLAFQLAGGESQRGGNR